MSISWAWTGASREPRVSRAHVRTFIGGPRRVAGRVEQPKILPLREAQAAFTDPSPIEARGVLVARRAPCPARRQGACVLRLRPGARDEHPFLRKRRAGSPVALIPISATSSEGERIMSPRSLPLALLTACLGASQ